MKFLALALAIFVVNSDASPLPCASCTLGQLKLTKGTKPGEIPQTPKGIVMGPNDCASLNVICDSSVSNVMVLMQFNNNQGGPSNGFSSKAAANLTCENNSWIYRENGVARKIDEINCLHSS